MTLSNKKFNKKKFAEKSQITLFLIMGFILLILLVYLSYNIFNVKKTSTKKNITNIDINNELLNSQVKNIIENCLSTNTKTLIEKIGQQGTLKPKNYIASKSTRIAYFYYKGEKYLPEKKDIENSISENLKFVLKDCIEKENLKIVDQKDPEIKAILTEKELNIKVNFENEVIFQGKKLKLKEYYFNIETNLSSILNTVKNFIFNFNNDEWLNLNEFEKQSYKVNIIKIDSTTWIYEIIDDKGLENNYFSYRFGVKYEL
ncbi:MAG: hypothetical protein QW757_05600 [Candidatus Woesearchaeota archaeon]